MWGGGGGGCRMLKWMAVPTARLASRGLGPIRPVADRSGVWWRVGAAWSGGWGAPQQRQE